MQADNSRQSFLDDNLERILDTARIGLVGLGGGGSQINTQLVHIGFQRVFAVDDQLIDRSNLTRLIGGTRQDVEEKIAKTEIAHRVARGIDPNTQHQVAQSDWKSEVEKLKSCDVIIAAVDTFSEREQLEAFCRRFRIVYIDIGMKVEEEGDDALMYGQIIVSVPGRACMKCMDFINSTVLAAEVEGYGDVGVEPQLVWSNGVLASSAVGLLLSMLCSWNAEGVGPTYLEYDGNRHTVSLSGMQRAVQSMTCVHYPDDQVGEVSIFQTPPRRSSL